MNVVENGLYSVSDAYFKACESDWFCDNKNEKRPYFLHFKDESGIIWLIPLSTQAENYKEKIERYKSKNKECFLYHIGTIMKREQAFLIGNMFPVTEQYIKQPYTFSGQHYVVQDKALLKVLRRKAKRYLVLVKSGKIHPNVDILSIAEKLQQSMLLTK